MSEPSWRIDYASAARRDVRRLDPQIRAGVIAAIERAAAGDPRADIRKLAGSDEHRLRVGESSVRFRGDAASRELVIPRVLPHGRAYDR